MDTVLASLTEWMPSQRWYASKGASPLLRLLALHEWAPADAVQRDEPDDTLIRVVVVIVADESVSPLIVYQVPVVERRRPPALEDASPHVIGAASPTSALIDGPHDTAFTHALLREVTGIGPSPATVLSGEQSNTSIIYSPQTTAPLIVKIFRQLHPDPHPDIELQTALAESGSRHVPRARGHIWTTWEDPQNSAQRVSGSLAFAQEFLPGVEDAWRVARRAAAAGQPFDREAHALGEATADVHLRLAQLFETMNAEAPARSVAASAWERRLNIATQEIPQLARHHDAVAAVYRRALATQWPPFQRIHGDYHLGQVLHTPDRGWMLLDFEGEPMRPMDERRRPDSALRDIAGMLRSFDYVASSLHGDAAASDLARWASSSRDSFLSGYEERSHHTVTGPLLDAFELDKAIYEAIYEARNRPDWLSIPLAAIDRLVAFA